MDITDGMMQSRNCQWHGSLVVQVRGGRESFTYVWPPLCRGNVGLTIIRFQDSNSPALIHDEKLSLSRAKCQHHLLVEKLAVIMNERYVRHGRVLAAKWPLIIQRGSNVQVRILSRGSKVIWELLGAELSECYTKFVTWSITVHDDADDGHENCAETKTVFNLLNIQVEHSS